MERQDQPLYYDINGVPLEGINEVELPGLEEAGLESEEAFRRRAEEEARRLRTGGQRQGQRQGQGRAPAPPTQTTSLQQRRNLLLEPIRNNNLPRLRLLLRQNPHREDLIEAFNFAVAIGNLPIV